MTAIGQHNGTKVAGGTGADHGASKTKAVNIGDQSRVIDVRMGKNNVINFSRVEHQVAVHTIGFKSFALEHAAIEQYLLPAISGNQVFASGNFAGGADKFYFHGCLYLRKLKSLFLATSNVGNSDITKSRKLFFIYDFPDSFHLLPDSLIILPNEVVKLLMHVKIQAAAGFCP